MWAGHHNAAANLRRTTMDSTRDLPVKFHKLVWKEKQAILQAHSSMALPQ